MGEDAEKAAEVVSDGRTVCEVMKCRLDDRNHRTVKRNFFVSINFILLFPAILFAETVEEYFAKGNRAYQQGNLPEAIQFYEKVVEQDMTHAPAYNALGRIYWDRRADLSQITWYFERALEADPLYLEAYENLARVYQEAGDMDQAENYFKQILVLNPNDTSAQFALGWIYLLSKSQPRDAVHYFHQVLTTNKIPKAYFGLGLGYIQIGEQERALEVITELKGLGQNDLANTLEEAMRKPLSPAALKEVATSSVQPPSSPSVLIPSTPPAVSPSSDPSASGVMKVRLRGKMFNVDGKEK